MRVHFVFVPVSVGARISGFRDYSMSSKSCQAVIFDDEHNFFCLYAVLRYNIYLRFTVHDTRGGDTGVRER